MKAKRKRYSADFKAQVALEAGNSEQVIVKHYRHLRTERQARAWFAVTPDAQPNVVPLPAAAVA